MPSPPAPIKPGVIKDPAVAALFSNKDPEARYNDLREIGHGSFGAVYFAFDKDKSETVAIKKMAFNGKQASEKWTDILKEVAFLNKISHPNIVQYKACFLKEHTCWLVMEYCIGSTADVVDVLRRGLREVEISEICSQTLQALHYLHSLKRIHRDIKAGNILLSDQAVIKLADFGSASLANPAQTFIGTPFFMAPEVILAMDEGHYNEKADIWSLGITCIELAERRPPLFNMNAMSALYHIAQNEPPTLSPIINDDQPEWTDTFQSFISKCLCKEPDERMTTSECMSHPFIACQRPRDTISELISRSKNKVMELDNFQYKKMRKLMYLDEAEGRDGDDGFGSGSGAGSEDMDFSNSGVDALSVDRGDSTSSRSASLTSFKSSSGTGGAGRRPPIPTSMRDPMDNNNGRSESELKNRTLIPVGDLSADSEKECGTGSTRPPSPLAAPMRTDPQHIKDDMATLRKSKFATLRSAKLISKEQEEYTKENNMYEQMSGYKRLRQGHHKELKQMEEKQGTETEALKVKLDKELEQLHASSGKEKQRVKMSHQSDLERKKKDVEDGERKLKKQIVAKQGPEMRAFSTLQLKEYKHNKELAKSSMKERGMRGGDYEIAVKNLKSSLSRARAQSEAAFEAKLRNESEMEIGRYKRAQLSSLHSLEERLNEEELDLLERQAETRQAMMLRHHDVTRQMEMGHTREMHALKKKHQDTQHEAESTNQSDYNRRLKEELHKKHALQSRQQPRELKLKEAQIRKQYRQAVKTQTRQFKLWQTQVLQAAPREEQKDIEKRLKEEQKRKIALLASQYDSQIENMVQEKTVKLESWQIEEEKHLNEKLAKELEELRAYQTRQRDMLESMIHKERCQLDERISVRRALLDSRAAEERAEILRLRESRRASLASRQLDEKRRMEEETGHSTTL